MNNRRSLHLLAEAYKQVVEKQVQAQLKEGPLLQKIGNSNIARKLTGRPSQEQELGWQDQAEANRINMNNYNLLKANLRELEKIKTALPAVLSQLQQSYRKHEGERDTNRSNTDQKWNKGNYDGKPSGYDLDRAEKSKQSDDFRRQQAGKDAEKGGNQVSDANELKDKVDTLQNLLSTAFRNIGFVYGEPVSPEALAEQLSSANIGDLKSRYPQGRGYNAYINSIHDVSLRISLPFRPNLTLFMPPK